MTPVPTISITTPDLEDKDFISKSAAVTPEIAPEPDTTSESGDKESITELEISDSIVNEETTKKKTLQSFYQKKSIFLTGATGFIGKAVLWKLLHSLSDSVDKIFILLRPTRTNQNSPEGRLKDDILSNKAIFVYRKGKFIINPTSIGFY
jgi:FlaA1/EpsC-like NDP-sugar epimerase